MKKKIRKLSTIVCLSLFLLCLTITAHASDTSQNFVAAGRAFLFNDGNPTYSGLLEANAKFKEALDPTAGDLNDPEANLFYAVTRILAFGLENGTEFGTLRDMFESFGISRNNVDLVKADAPFNEPPLMYDQYDPPDTIPGGEDVRAFLAGPFVTLLGNAIANLGKIESSFTTFLTGDETGDEAVEVDYGDVLVLKSVLYMLKSSILIATAYNLDIDLRELVVLGNAGVLQIQRDILDKYQDQDVLKLRGTNGADGAESLARAKEALLYGIDAYEAAFNFITITESSDPQEDELFYFGSSEDQREANFILTQLTELKNSLNDNQVAEFITVEDTWILTDGNGKRLQIEIEKDVNGNFVCGHAWGMDGCDFLFCGGWVEDYTVSGTTITFNMACSGWCPGSATLTGTLGENQIIKGTYSAANCERNWSGTFTGLLESSKTETEIINFNLIFGNTNKSPLDIRTILPKFDQDDEPIAGTFPPTDDSSAVLNGILPEFTTNDDLTREMNIQPSGFFNIPTASITIDGNPGDWPESALLHTDPSGDNDTDLTGTDIEKVYLAKDETNLYMAMFLYDGNPNTVAATHYNVQFSSERNYDGNGEMLILIGTYYSSTQEEWSVMSLKRDPAWGWDWQTINSYTGYASAGTKFIEWKVPLSDIQAVIGSINGRFIATEIYTSHYEKSCEWNDTGIKLNTSQVSGSVTCPKHTSGKIFIYAYDGSNPNTANELGNTYISAPGAYEITGLPIGADVYLFARWDTDDNGIKTFYDYLGKTGPIIVADGGTTVPEFSINTLIDNDYIMTKPGLYRVFGSNSYTIPQNYDGPWDPNDVDWEDIWTFIGESNKTGTFNTEQYYKNILIIWGEEPIFNFDAFEDLTAVTAFATNADGTSCGYSWITSGLKNFKVYDWSEPYYFKGHPDGLYASTQDWSGFSLFTMPDNSVEVATPRKLKITLVSNLLGDLDEDNDVGLSDAILALRVVSNSSNVITLKFNSDVNGDARIGIEEAIYALQVASGLKDMHTKNPEEYVSIEGHVYFVGTTTPVQGALVSTFLDSQTATTDATGHFFLQTNTLAEYSSIPYTITIFASGYQAYSVEHTWGDHPIDQVFYLNP